MITLREHVSLAPLTTFNIGGSARFFCEASSLQDLQESLQWARAHDTPFVVIGGGSNLLISDEGIDALVIKVVNKKWNITNDLLEAEAGCTLLEVIRVAAMLKRGGWEKLAGIPGSIGGAVRGNAGAFGSEIKEFVYQVIALNAQTFEVRVFSNTECEFEYRHSFFKQHPEWIITLVQMKLEKVVSNDARMQIEATIAERQKRHIQDVQAAGSYFVNPVVDVNIQQLFEREKNTTSKEGRVPAGWLIEKAGMKGARVGQAEASEQHPNYLKNNGGATANDVKELARRIKEAVKDTFGVELKEEAVVF